MMLHFDNNDGLSGRGLMISLEEGKDGPFNKITANWATQFAVILLNDLFLPLQLSLLRGSQRFMGHWYMLATQQ